VPPMDVPAPAAGPAGRRPSWRRRVGRRVLITLVILVIAAATATARLFVWPDQGMPPTVSAIVMLDVPGGRLNNALRLAAQHRAPFLLISLGMPGGGYGCPRPVRRVTLICFNPSPATTQGEAEYVGKLARRYYWRSIAVVTTTPQDSRARLRMERCFAGPVYVVATPIALTSWPYQVAYEWGALAKALVVQRSC
jgi:uncharacterized SAM-binding protein YcdF (DUF218 family)